VFDANDLYFESADVNEIAISNDFYIPDAAECMRCGMCVSHCPTFRLFQIDEETPRRRIRTLSKILVEQQSTNADELRHLDNCLQCRACETACPSQMRYGALFDQALAKRKITLPWQGKLGLALIARKNWRYALLPLISVYFGLGLNKTAAWRWLAHKLGLSTASDALPQRPALGAIAAVHPVKNAHRGQVALFSGCLSEHFDRQTLDATINLLNTIGFSVITPPQQGCCGAIHQHNAQSAADLIANNIAVFNALDVQAVLYTASGCGAMLSEYTDADSSATQLFNNRLQDATSFILAHWPPQLALSPLAQTVAVHEPCSQRNVLKNQQAVYQLLAKIPDLQILSLDGNALCCGAGGSYFLTHPDNAFALRAIKLQHISTAAVDTVISGNYGCASFMQTDAIRVIHPLVLLAEQLLIN